MARTDRTGAIGATMDRSEILGGFCYLPFYLVFLSWILTFLSGILNLDAAHWQINTAYFLCNFAAVAIIFRRFLAVSFRPVRQHFWLTVQAVILGFALYYFLYVILYYPLHFWGPEIRDLAQENIQSLLSANFVVTCLCSVILAPVVEETLVRGLLFANLRPQSRILAYVVSALVFSFLHVYQSFGAAGARDILLSMAGYLPASIAFCWTYEKSGTIWASIVLHGLVNAASLGLLSHLPGL